MSDSPEPAGDTPARPLVTLEDLHAADFEGPIRALKTYDRFQISMAFEEAARAAIEAGDMKKGQAFALLSAMIRIHLRDTLHGPAFGPEGSGNGFRTLLPEDLVGDQTTVLSALIPSIENPVLRARAADIAWTNNRRDGSAAKAAIDAYCTAAAAILAGELTSPYSMPPALDAVPLVRRAAQIEHQTTKKTKEPTHSTQLGAAFEKAYQASRVPDQVGIFLRVADLALSHRFKTNAEVAADAEAMLANMPAGKFMHAVHSLWHLVISIYERIGDKDARQRCLLGAVDYALGMRDATTHAVSAKVFWVKDALRLLQHVDGREDQERDLEIELRRLQKLALREMKPFPVHVHDDRKHEETVRMFSGYSLSNSLLAFALLDVPRDPQNLRAQALEAAKHAPLLAMLRGSHIDRHGRTAAYSEGASHEGEPDETWYRRTVGQGETLHRAQRLENHIEPARIVIHARYGIEERHLAPVVGLSNLVPDEQKPVLCLGFARFFQGDMMSAAYLLIPLLEATVRHLLTANGVDTGKIRDDTTEEDYSLSMLFGRFRPRIDEIFGPGLAAEIDQLFNTRPGPALRHEMAHGQITGAECFGQDIYFACWLMFSMCVLLVAHGWDQYIAPELNAIAGMPDSGSEPAA